MLYKDIKDDAKIVFGDCDGPLLRRRVKEALDVLANTGDSTWDGLLGEMTICVDPVCGQVTLPRDVLKPLSITIDGCPTFPRDRWFQYHLNGPGQRWGAFSGAWDDKGFFAVCREPSEATRLRISAEAEQDDGKTITLDVINEDGIEERLEIVLDGAGDVDTTVLVKQVLRVNKGVTTGIVNLFYLDPVLTLAGLYYPDEKNPQWRRIRVRAQSTIGILYRRQTREILSDEDYIPLNSKMAVMQALWSIKKRYQGDIPGAQAAQQDAQLLLEQDQYARQVTGTPVGPQVLDYSYQNNERLHDFRGGYHRGY